MLRRGPRPTRTAPLPPAPRLFSLGLVLVALVVPLPMPLGKARRLRWQRPLRPRIGLLIPPGATPRSTLPKRSLSVLGGLFPLKCAPRMMGRSVPSPRLSPSTLRPPSCGAPRSLPTLVAGLLLVRLISATTSATSGPSGAAISMLKMRRTFVLSIAFGTTFISTIITVDES